MFPITHQRALFLASLIFASEICCWLRELQMYSIEERGMLPHKRKTLCSSS